MTLRKALPFALSLMFLATSAFADTGVADDAGSSMTSDAGDMGFSPDAALPGPNLNPTDTDEDKDDEGCCATVSNPARTDAAPALIAMLAGLLLIRRRHTTRAN